MTLSELLKSYNKDFNIVEYRKYSNGEDGLLGMAKYVNKILISLDGGKYHLNDKIAKHELVRDDWLVVWKE